MTFLSHFEGWPWLRPLSWLYGGGGTLRRWAYGRGLLPSYQLPVPVLSVGGMAVGGSGKTPISEWVGDLLEAQGWTVALLSRGYGGSPGKHPWFLGQGCAFQTKESPSAPLQERFLRWREARGKKPPWFLSQGEPFPEEGSDRRLPSLSEQERKAVEEFRSSHKSDRGLPSLPAPRREESLWKIVGDEPLLHHLRRPRRLIGIHPDRVWAGQLAIEAGAQVLLLDDGFQHLRLRRDLDILTLSPDLFSSRPRVLPAGRLREPLAALDQADLLLLYPTPPSSLPLACPLPAQISLSVQGLVNRPGGPLLFSPLQLAHQRAILFAGIGRFAHFEDTARRAGLLVVEAHSFADHHPFSVEEIKALEQRRQTTHADFLLCTEKDLVRLPSPLPSRLYALSTKITPSPLARTLVQQLLQRLLPSKETQKRQRSAGSKQPSLGHFPKKSRDKPG